MVTPNGELKIKMENIISKASGIVDTNMTMPDGQVGKARIVENEKGKSSNVSFILFVPPVLLEELEGTFAEQKILLAEELKRLKEVLEER